MTTAAMIYADVHVVLDHPVELVWPHIAAFGELDRWAAGVVGCAIDGEGVGAIRTISLGNREARERLEAIDPVAYSLRYHILPPHVMPASNVYSDISLVALYGRRTGMAWRSAATDFEIPPEQLGAGIERFYRQSIAQLDRLLRGA